MKMSMKIMLIPMLAASLIGCVSCSSPKPTLLQQKVAEARAERMDKVNTFSSGGSTFVTILITGLTSLGDADSSATPPKILYLIDATSPGGSLMAHAPIVMTDAVYNPVATGRTLESEGAAARFLRLTNGEKLSFKEANPALSPLTYSKTEPLATCPEDTDRGSLFFIPRLSRVGMNASGGTLSSADYDSTFLNPQAGGPVAAFFPIDYGELLSWFQTPLVWDFKDGTAGKKKTTSQVLADAVIWKFAIPGNTLTLQSNGSELLRMKAVQNKIFLTIANAPDPDGIKLLAGTATNLHPKKSPVDEHFVLYYRFLTDKSVTPFRPVVQGVCRNGVVVTDDCTLANFVEIPRTGSCPPPPPGEMAPPLVGGLNCGPDGMP